MRGIVAKRLRKLVYGDASMKVLRSYKWKGDRKTGPICIIVEGFRAAYKKSKKTYKEAKARGLQWRQV